MERFSRWFDGRSSFLETRTVLFIYGYWWSCHSIRFHVEGSLCRVQPRLTSPNPLQYLSLSLFFSMRLGFVTAPIPLHQKLVYHQQVTSMHASSLSQVNHSFEWNNHDWWKCLDDCIEIIRTMGSDWISCSYSKVIFHRRFILKTNHFSLELLNSIKRKNG